MSDNATDSTIMVEEENGKPETLEECTTLIQLETKVEQIGDERADVFEEDDLPLDLILKEENEQQALHDAMNRSMDSKVPEFTVEGMNL